MADLLFRRFGSKSSNGGRTKTLGLDLAALFCLKYGNRFTCLVESNL